MAVRELVFSSKRISGPLNVDDAVAKLLIPAKPTGRIHLMGIDCDYSAAVAVIKTITISESPEYADGILELATAAIGSTDDRVQLTLVNYMAGREHYHYANVAGGIVLPAGTIPADTWGAYSIVGSNAGVVTIIAAAANYTTGYASEALALAALPALIQDGRAVLAHFTVLTAVGLVFVADTDALQGGASGNASSDTNYFQETAIVFTAIGAPTRWDFTNGAYLRALPGILTSEKNRGFLIELEASGTSTITGRVTAYVAAP